MLVWCARLRRSKVFLRDQPIENEPPYRIVERGIALVPEGRRLFGDMTVVENLRLGAYSPHARAHENEQLERQFVAVS